MNKAVPYYRVSRKRQGISGLGLEAQQTAVRDYAERYNFELMKEHTEVESAKRNKRPVLQEALKLCEECSATLLIAKLDRLGRNTFFIAKLMESGVDFIAVDNPEANKFMLHVMAAFAEYEGEQISLRTREALAEAKKRGVSLGIYGRLVLSQQNKENADEFARKMKPVVDELKSKGFKSVRSLTKEFNKRSIATYTGKTHWHVQTVYSLLKRIKDL